MTLPHEPTEKERKQVEQLSAVGIRQEVIADILDIDPKTLRKYYRKELDTATARANAAIGGKLYSKALEGDTPSMIFWLKTRGEWSEKKSIELSGSIDLTGKTDAELKAIIDKG